MKKRLITGLVLAAIFIPLLIIPEFFVLFQILMIFLAIVATMEMIKMYEKDKPIKLSVKIGIIIATILVYMSALSEWAPSSIFADGAKLLNIKIQFLPMFILVLLILFSSLVFIDDYNAIDIGKALIIITYVGIGFAAITILRFMGIRFIMYLFIISIATDVFAYIVGVSIGKHKMCPKISPKKSWEGAIGGTIAAVLLGGAFAYFYGNLFGHIFGPDQYPTIFHGIIQTDNVSNFVIIILIIIITLFGSIFSQIGDLVASRLKRNYNIKDFGQIFPGHGGVLDRLDSALFSAIYLLSMFTVLTNFLPGALS